MTPEEALLEAIRQCRKEQDKRYPIIGLRTMEQIAWGSFMNDDKKSERFYTLVQGYNIGCGWHMNLPYKEFLFNLMQHDWEYNPDKKIHEYDNHIKFLESKGKI